MELRAKLFPDLKEEELWARQKYDGFTTIPRTMPLVMSIIDDLTKGAPASSTYLELWGRAYDEMYVPLNNPDVHAFHAGFTGQRAKRTWVQRIESLAELGFIYTAGGTSGKHAHAVIVNPHLALKRLKDKGQPGLTTDKYNALVERGIEVGAKDVDADMPEPPPVPPIKPVAKKTAAATFAQISTK
ncbi:hypothetical protein [Labrenzia sp. PHM005]|uniref:hypothetical protein n=1 Tax=Labrenzia sp. PHM005 TaxID=2590016 RepID=UPI001AD8C747|nr:hypothetical protein [Labrenzia sp. PHM005]